MWVLFQPRGGLLHAGYIQRSWSGEGAAQPHGEGSFPPLSLLLGVHTVLQALGLGKGQLSEVKG